MDKDLFAYWAKQFPVALTVAWLGFVAIKALVKYLVSKDQEKHIFFIKELEKKDAIISSKDDEIKELNLKLVNLTVKSNEVMESLRKLLQRAINDKI